MKKIVLLFISSVLLCVGCNSNEPVGDGASKNEIQTIANQYGYKLENSKSDIFKVSNTKELKVILEKIDTNFKTAKIQSIGNVQNNEKNNKQQIDNIYNEISKKKSHSDQTARTNQTAEDDNPPFDRSVTFYFDNNFPCSNVYVTVNYNTNQSGQFTDAEITTGSYGISYGNTYSQVNVISHMQGGVLVFQVTGQFSTSLGIGSFSLNNATSVNYTGYIQSSSFGGNLNGQAYQQNDIQDENLDTHIYR
jgi:hypothetical protein